jgi:hypothetical protein
VELTLAERIMALYVGCVRLVDKSRVWRGGNAAESSDLALRSVS